jgi:hypothetical protein
MNEDDEIYSVRRLRTPKVQPAKHSMSDDASRLGLRLVEELSETTCPHPAGKRIRRGIVWQAAYSVLRTHPEGLAASPQSSNHSEHTIVSSSPMTPYTH